MRKIVLTTLVATFVCTLSIPAFASENTKGVESWATRNSGTVITEEYEEYYKGIRDVLKNALGPADNTGAEAEQNNFTSVGYFKDGITFTFDKESSDKKTWIKSAIVNNPDASKPDLLLNEITWNGENCDHIGEGVKIYAVNYNGTGEEKLVAYVYNKTAKKHIEKYNKENGTSIVLPEVKGSKVESAYSDVNYNIYSSKVYFSDDFKYCSAVRIVDMTEELKAYGGGCQYLKDGFDLDAVMAYNVVYNYNPNAEAETDTKNPSLGTEKEKTEVKGEVAGQYDESPSTGDAMSMTLVLILVGAAIVMTTTSVAVIKRRK